MIISRLVFPLSPSLLLFLLKEMTTKPGTISKGAGKILQKEGNLSPLLYFIMFLSSSSHLSSFFQVRAQLARNQRMRQRKDGSPSREITLRIGGLVGSSSKTAFCTITRILRRSVSLPIFLYLHSFTQINSSSFVSSLCCLQELKPTNFFVLAGARVEPTPNNPCGFDLIMSNGERRSMQVCRRSKQSKEIIISETNKQLQPWSQ